MRINFVSAILLGWFGICASVSAELRWDLSGFATLGAGKTNRDSLSYMDYDEDWSVDSDTMLGLQLVVEPIDRLSVTGQVVTRGHSFGDIADYEAELEWFFLSYDLSEQSRVRAGRLRTPYQYFSESLEVGYSYVWVRPPPNVYAFLFEPFKHFEGVDYNHIHYGDDFDTELRLLYGRQKGTFLRTEAQIEQVWGGTVTVRWPDLSLRYAFLDHTVDFTVPDFQPLIDGLNDATVIDPGFAEIADQYSLENGRMRYHSLAADWRLDEWNVVAERYQLEPPDKQLNNSSQGWYISLARQMGRFTPYFVTGAYKSSMGKEMLDRIDEVYGRVEPQYPFLPPETVAGLQTLQANAIFAYKIYVVEQRSYTLGVRYDWLSNAALKMELEYVEFASDSTGHFIHKGEVIKGPSDPNDAMVLTLLIDVVF